jgi:uncharacterized membrane protein YuzA (DUF378 family)
MIPASIFAAGLTVAYVLVGVGAVYLLAVLAAEWRAGKLW